MNLRGCIQFICQTDVGRVREHNEDYLNSDESIGLAVLADGMGGLNAGEVASAMAVRVLMEELGLYKNGMLPLGQEVKSKGEPDQPDVLRALKYAIEKANGEVFHASQTQAQYRGMGTTVVVSLFHDNKVAVGHIGDSRMYRFRAEKLEQLTKDHSYVQELIDSGQSTIEEARRSKKKNIITRALGIGARVEAEVHEHRVKVGDVYLMCSDGLTDLVSDKDIESFLANSGNNLSELAAHLIQAANSKGGKDNISVILTKISRPFPERAGIMAKLLAWFK